MNEKHYQQELSAYVNNEMPQERRQLIAQHILQCERCRDEHDSIRRVASLAGVLPRADAPANTWSGIEAAMAGGPKSSFSFLPFRVLAAAAAGLAILLGSAAAVYFGAFRERNSGVAHTVPAKPADPAAPAPAPSLPAPPPNPDPPAIAITPVRNSTPAPLPNAPTNSAPLPRRLPDTPSNPTASWAVETIAGTPKIGNSADGGTLAVGELLETDSRSRARIAVADIGNVDVAPNSRVRLINTTSAEHRLSLERGQVHAKINAPPRLFIVDTPSAVAVDLGCEYTLEVDAAGNSTLQVTAGYVSLERDGRESIVPAGAYCLTKKGKGLGTPYFDDATPAFRAALAKFDFERGGTASLATILKDAGAADTLTLWHLLPRVGTAEREKVFAALVSFVALPPGVNRRGILELDQKMLESWRVSMEDLWFE
jgi:hypothetical protein